MNAQKKRMRTSKPLFSKMKPLFSKRSWEQGLVLGGAGGADSEIVGSPGSLHVWRWSNGLWLVFLIGQKCKHIQQFWVDLGEIGLSGGTHWSAQVDQLQKLFAGRKQVFFQQGSRGKELQSGVRVILPHFCSIFGTRKNKKQRRIFLFFVFWSCNRGLVLIICAVEKKKGLHFMLVGGMGGCRGSCFSGIGEDQEQFFGGLRGFTLPGSGFSLEKIQGLIQKKRRRTSKPLFSKWKPFFSKKSWE